VSRRQLAGIIALAALIILWLLFKIAK